MKTLKQVFFALLILAAGVTIFPGEPLAAYPDKPVELIAPANPGGGWDLTCRMSAQVLKEAGLVSQPVVVINKPGGFGVVAMTDIIRNRTQDQNVLTAFSAVLTTQMSINKNPFTYRDVIPVSVLFVDYGTIAVNKSSKYASFKELADDWKKQPGAVSFAGSSPPGGLDHMRVAMMAKQLGIPVKSIRYVAFQGGADALAALLGGHVTVFVGDAGEIAGHAESGVIRPLAVLSDRKLSGIFDKVPMASDFGVNVSSANWRGFYAAPGMKKENIAYWEDTFGKMVKSKQWKTVLEKQAWVDLFLTGKKLQKFLDDELAMYQELARELGLVK
jgi:putative tricarboxylic transport membrane protein